MAGQSGEWDMIDVLGLEVLEAQSVSECLILVDEKVAIVPAGTTRQKAADQISTWWARRSSVA